MDVIKVQNEEKSDNDYDYYTCLTCYPKEHRHEHYNDGCLLRKVKKSTKPSRCILNVSDPTVNWKQIYPVPFNIKDILYNYNSTKMIGEVERIFGQLIGEKYEWRSFYAGWIEGRFTLYGEVSEDSRDHSHHKCKQKPSYDELSGELLKLNNIKSSLLGKVFHILDDEIGLENIPVVTRKLKELCDVNKNE
jgi:hypothetical protein